MQKINKNEKTSELYRAILNLSDIDECRKFFRDLWTADEVKEFSERWYVVQCLSKGLSYRDISKLSGLSTATITRVAKWYKSGSGGYRLIVKRMQQANLEENI